MKSLLVSLIAVLMLPCALAAGANGVPGQQPANNAARDPKFMIQQYEVAAITLSDDQKAQITQIVNDYWKASDEFYAKNRDNVMKARDEYIKTMQGHDQEAQEAARQSFAAAEAPMEERGQKYAESLRKVLTPAQTAKYKDYYLTKNITQYALPNVLTDAQMKAVKDALSQNNATTADLMAVFAAIDDVLTPQQKVVKTKHYAMNIIKGKYYPKVAFTDDQKKQIESICERFAKDDTLSAQEVAAKTGEKILAMMTPEQKQAFNAPRTAVVTTQPAPATKP